MSDVCDAVESLNFHALEHAGKSNERYIAFLRQAAERILVYAEDTESESNDGKPPPSEIA